MERYQNWEENSGKIEFQKLEKLKKSIYNLRVFGIYLKAI